MKFIVVAFVSRPQQMSAIEKLACIRGVLITERAAASFEVVKETIWATEKAEVVSQCRQTARAIPLRCRRNESIDEMTGKHRVRLEKVQDRKVVVSRVRVLIPLNGNVPVSCF